MSDCPHSLDAWDAASERCAACGESFQRAQRQDSLTDQLRDVVALATRAGCYDAADFIRVAGGF